MCRSTHDSTTTLCSQRLFPVLQTDTGALIYPLIEEYEAGTFPFKNTQVPMTHYDDAVSIKFTIHGKVQGVFFRKHTQLQGTKLGLRGWCMNTAEGAVVGEAHGPGAAIEQMSRWLSEVGSPKSKIKQAQIEPSDKPASEFAAAFEVRK